MASIEDHIQEGKIKEVFITLLVSAFGFVAALFWRDAIKDAINEFIPQGEGWIWSIYSAIIVTVIIIAAIFVLYKVFMSRDLTEAVGIDKVRRKAKKKILKKVKR